MATNQDNSQDLELKQSRLTAYALGQLDDQQRRQVELELQDDENSRRMVEEVQMLSQVLADASKQDNLPPASTDLREAIMRRLDTDRKVEPGKGPQSVPSAGSRPWLALVVAICLVVVAVPVGWMMSRQNVDDESVASKSSEKRNASSSGDYAKADWREGGGSGGGEEQYIFTESKPADSGDGATATYTYGQNANEAARPPVNYQPSSAKRLGPGVPTPDVAPAVTGLPNNSTAPTTSPGYDGRAPASKFNKDSEFRVTGGGIAEGADFSDIRKSGEGEYPGSEQYDQITENRFLPVNEQHAVSTFSIDVDTASYANVRRFLTRNMLPPPNAVRIEEMVNYFSYDYPQPQGEIPFSVNMEVAECPWKPSNRLLRIGLKGLEVDRDERPASNLVFLLDTSGSMRSRDKLPLLQQAMKMLVRELHENDLITIVTYAGNAGLRLDATPGDQQDKIIEAIDSLSAGGSTHGSAGIMLAYQKAVENFIDEGTNRVILATDGDLNVGITRDDALVNLIKEKAASGVFLTVLGFGTGNLKDSKMEKLADNGNGVYAYIDGQREARKVLVDQISASLVTIAKDVKIQIEFNPAEVQSYRLIGYENRLLAREDFDDDTKDAGEIGAGHTVTALYELVPAGADVKEERGGGKLKYQKTEAPDPKKPEDLTDAATSGEMLTLWLRYKQPDGDKSRRLEFTLKDGGQKFNRASQDYQFAAAVASFGMMLRGSEHQGSMSYSAIEEIASSAVGKDPKGYRMEFVDLVRKASQLQR